MLATQLAKDRLNLDPWGCGLVKEDGSGNFVPDILRLVNQLEVISYEESKELSAGYIRADVVFGQLARVRFSYCREKMPNSPVDSKEELIEYIIEVGNLYSGMQKLLEIQFSWIGGKTEHYGAGNENESDEEENVSIGFDVDVAESFAKKIGLHNDRFEIPDIIFFLLTMPFHETETEVDVLIAKKLFGVGEEEEDIE
eukprot:g4967.t1